MNLDFSSSNFIEFFHSKYIDDFCEQTKVKLIDVYNEHFDSNKAIKYDKIKIGAKYFSKHFIPIKSDFPVANSLGRINSSFFTGNFYLDLQKEELYYE